MADVQRDLFSTVTVTDTRTLAATFERSGIDAEACTIPMCISTDSPVAGPTGMREVLRHTPEAVDLSRAERGLPLQIAHRPGELPVGRVEHLTVADGRLRGIARFSLTVRGQDAWRDVVDGIISDVSVGASVAHDAWDEEVKGVLVARRWTPVEVSLVSVGADPGAGINRGQNMKTEKATEKDDTREAVSALFRGLEGEAWLRMERDALVAGDSVDVVRTRVMDELKAQAAPAVSRTQPDTQAIAGPDSMDKWVAMCEQALDHKLGVKRFEPSELAHNELAGMSFREMARDYLRARGERSGGMSAERMVERAISLPSVVRSNLSHSTSDFSNLLGSSAEKFLSTGYMEAPETYQAWTRNVSMSNFRQHSFVNLSLFGDLQQVREGETYTAGTFSDRVNTATLSTYGKLFTITRRALVDDDLSSLQTISSRMGRAAARQVGDLVYAVITDDTKLSEQAGATLFNTTDGNLAGSATVIDTANMSIARKALRTMTDPSGATLNIQPAYLLVPAAIETTAQVFLRTAAAPGGSDNDVNVFQNSMQLVVEPRLDADDVNAWYVMAAPGAEVDTVVVGWLDGRQEPYLEQQEGFTVDGLSYKVRIDCTAAALDWRGMYQNAGA